MFNNNSQFKKKFSIINETIINVTRKTMRVNTLNLMKNERQT